MTVLETALENWADWGLTSKPVLIHTFTEGQNHHTGLIAVGDQRLVIKIFNHAFEQTLKTEQWTSQQGLSPNIIYAGENTVLMHYIDDQQFSASKLPSLANKLRLLHDSEGASEQCFDLLGFANEYLSNADQLTQSWHQKLRPILVEFFDDPTPWVFCHNDLVKENCLFDNNNTVLIDWEFAMQHNPWFDLAAIVLYFELDEKNTETFLESYKPGWSKKMSKRIFYNSQASLLWTDLLWNMHKYGHEYRQQNPDRFNKLIVLAQALNITLSTNTK